jgi:hypothetical protein
MKYFFYLSALLLVSQTALSQPNTVAMELVRQNAPALGLTDNDIDNSTVSASYVIPGTSIRMVYLQQLFKGLPVFNQMQVMAFDNNLPVSNMGGRVADMESKTVPYSGLSTIPAANAVRAALAECGIVFTDVIQPVSDAGTQVRFGDLGVSAIAIEARQLWVEDTTGQVHLAWQVELAPNNTSDHWLIRIDAATGSFIDKNNYTVSCHWGNGEQQHDGHGHAPPTEAVQGSKAATRAPFLVNDASYRVIPYPAESPIHPGGAPAIRTNPWLLAPVGSNATTLKWHSNGTTDYIITRGNNVHAYEDRNSDNAAGAADTSSTPDPPLTFTKLYNFAQEPTVTNNQRAATTNLFYWNNIIHDISYIYGFTEVAGNFQVNNLGRGGTGNDAVNAEAQDGSGSNNANFSTPVDGTPGRMQMYIWTAANPDRDSDMDNGIILHEYAHGISNRLTGGPANSSCLSNQEQMGEGWSDYFCLMLTQDWATALPTDGFSKPRGIGTYARNEAITATGIRTHPYTTNMAVNPLTYTNVSTAAVPHGIGTVWCSILWDMTWDMIQLDGINPNLYDIATTGGNSAALKLVTEGMRLQPCSPGFVTGRNAILRADTLFFGARYSCIIWRAFARRGVGVNASQGLSTSRSDQVVDFTPREFDYTFTQNVPQQFEGDNIIYTSTPKSVCTPFVNHKVVDTLPTNVTYVSGGTYNAADRTVTFDGINLVSGASQTNSFTVRVNAGTYVAPVQHINQPVAGTTIPGGWTATSTTAAVWKVSNAQSVSAPNSFFTRDTSIVSDQILATSSSFPVTGITTLSFQHLHNAESPWDGGVVEISTNNGTTWSDLGNFFTSNGYTTTLNSGTNPLGGRRAFSGNSTTFKLSVIDLSSFRGQNIRIRFRFGSDNATGTTTGWFIDDIRLISEAAVITTARLLDAANAVKATRSLAAKIVTPAVLPLNLVSFGAYLQQQDAILQWATSSEVNTDVFEIERSFDGNRFDMAGQVMATAFANGAKYAFTDPGLTQLPVFKGVVYYRLKMKDRDGSFTYSKVVRLSSTGAGWLTISPNPVKDQLAISGFRDNRLYDMALTDLSGKVLQTGKLSFLNNRLSVGHLAAGMYILSVQTGQGKEVYRFVKE